MLGANAFAWPYLAGGGFFGPVTTDPSPSGGVALALDDGPLVAHPTWIRIDTLDGVGIDTINVHRGRQDERSKTEPGTVTMSGTDTQGLLDPTNSSGPFYGRLDPVKQGSVRLYNPTTDSWHFIYRGHSETYSFTVDPSENWNEFEITLVDMLDILNDAEVIPDEAGNSVPAESPGDCFYTGQRVDDRIYAVLADSATAFMGKTWPPSQLQIAEGNVYVQGRVYSNRTSLLQVLDEACDADFPGATNRFITKDGAFAFRGRYYRFRPSFYAASSDADRAPGHELVHWHVGDIPAFNDDNSLAVYTGLKFERGKTNLINAALVTPVGISDTQLASNSNFSSNSSSITDFGPRTSGMSLENLITADAYVGGDDALQVTASYGDATVENYKDPVTYVSSLTFRNPPGSDLSARAQRVWEILTGVELSDLVTVTSTHPGGGGFSTEPHFVESIDYQISPLQGDEWDVTLTLGLSSAQHFSFTPSSWSPPGG